MDAAPLARLRWRLRGAWMWPAFAVMTAVDGYIWHRLPIVGDAISAPAAYILAFIFNLIAIVALAPAGGFLIRRWRSDMPKLVARDYAGTAAVALVTAAILAGGLIHHHVVKNDSAALQSAAGLAQAYIGDHAPNTYLADLDNLDVYEVQPPQIYRACASNLQHTRWYCVVVHQNLNVAPQTISGSHTGYTVRYDGTESNRLLSDGTS